MKQLALYVLFLYSFTAAAQSYNGPESVDCDTLTGNWYISNTGSKKILRRTPAGVLQEFLSGFSNGPYGIEVVGDRIYACDGNKIKGFALSDGAPVFNITTNASFLNGITHDAAGLLYATDFSGKKIYKINPADTTWNVFVPQTTSTPNGIYYDQGQNRLVCVTWGSSAKMLGISLTDSTVTTLKTTTLSNIDGIARDGAGRWYVASWGANAIHRIEADFSGTPQQVLSGLNHPADIYYNLQTDTLGIPNAGNNTVTFAGFAPVSAVREALRLPEMEIFPNPVAENLTFELPDGWQTEKINCRAFAANGQQHDVLVISRDGKLCTCSVIHLPAGIYRLLITTGNRSAGATFLRG